MAEVYSYAKLATSKVITWFYNPEIWKVNFVCLENLNSHNHVRFSGGNTAFPKALNIYKPINNFSYPKEIVHRCINLQAGRRWWQWAQFNCFWTGVNKMYCQELLCPHNFSLHCKTTEWFWPSLFITFAYISKDIWNFSLYLFTPRLLAEPWLGDIVVKPRRRNAILCVNNS
jgi:hypothetical protein